MPSIYYSLVVKNNSMKWAQQNSAHSTDDFFTNNNGNDKMKNLRFIRHRALVVSDTMEMKRQKKKRTESEIIKSMNATNERSIDI